MSFGDALLGNNHPAGLREIDTPLLDEKFFSDDYSFARKTAAPPFAGLVAADEHGARTDKALRPAPSAPHSEQVAIDVLVGAKEVPVAAGADSGGGHGGNLSTVVGIFAASTAVTMVAAGPVSPPVAFGAFLLLLGGLLVSVSRVLENQLSVGTAAGAAPSSPNAAQVTIDVDFVAEAIEAKRAVGGRGSNLASAVVGIVTASSAVTMVAAGDVSPPVAFGLFVLMIAGLSLAVSGVRRV
ncbi:Os08g0183100 [Oryza sativa Japonica Group]|uniref:Os08g0183100 protein n=1 Tax=Oryza sativa subsp. japonica TaxID=39947 RepID=A0A0P0XCM4_ORYSJ|nr:Os08g0183100 [Oryza sativa Japonica Group]